LRADFGGGWQPRHPIISLIVCSGLTVLSLFEQASCFLSLLLGQFIDQLVQPFACHHDRTSPC
jgi:hypothetical protein